MKITTNDAAREINEIQDDIRPIASAFLRDDYQDAIDKVEKLRVRLDTLITMLRMLDKH